MPHVGYADSIMNDGQRSNSDIFDKNSSNLPLESSRYLYQTFLLCFIF